MRKFPKSYGILLRRAFTTKMEEYDKPIKFTTSQAFNKSVLASVKHIEIPTTPWYQPYSVCGSVALFLIYFCILREENDMDREFDKTLYDRIQGLEKQQLIISYRYNKENGLSTLEIEQRLKELNEQESKELSVT